jgi:hypothetical protein
MDCRKFRNNLEDYLQGGLDFPGRFGMERHARQCFSCGREVADAQKLGQMARKLHRITAPPDFEAAVLARIHSETRRHSGWLSGGFQQVSWRTLALAGSAIGLLVAGVLSAGFLTMQPTDPLPPPAVSIPVAETHAGPSIIDSVPSRDAPAIEPISTVTSAPTRRSRPLSTEADRPLIEAADSEFQEFLVPAGDRQLIIRLPKAIRMQYHPPSEEYFIRNVSH